jgi:hypothetical protein
MENILMSCLLFVVSFLFFTFILILLLVFFIPILPVMLLAFPMTVLNAGTSKIHWTQKPYLWYFNNVWLNFIYTSKIFKK